METGIQSIAAPGARRRSLLLASGALVLGGAARAQAPIIVRAPNKITFRVATIVAESNPYVDGLNKWKQLVEERTGGTVVMNIFHTAQLGDERSTNEGLLTGTVHAGIGAGAWAGFVPAYNVVSLPFLVRDLNHSHALADGEVGRRIGELAEAKGFKVLAYYTTGDQHFQTRTKPIRSMADVEGLKMRVIENRSVVAGFRAFGAVPAPLPYSQIYTALQQGTVEGTANDIISVTTMRLYEVAKFHTLSTYLAEPRPLIMSKAFFDKLPADVQKVVLDAAVESSKFERTVYEKRAAIKLEEAKTSGMTILTLTDREKWVDAVRPVWENAAKASPDAAALIKLVASSN